MLDVCWVGDLGPAQTETGICILQVHLLRDLLLNLASIQLHIERRLLRQVQSLRVLENIRQLLQRLLEQHTA
jgi:hypothetical protein